MKRKRIQTSGIEGFTLIESLVSMAVMLPLVAAAIMLFRTGVLQHDSEQRTVAMNQEARNALEMMTLEIAQAGSRGDSSTTTTAAITASANSQSVSVSSSDQMNAGDWVEVDTGGNKETVKVLGTGNNSITAVFRSSHALGIPIRLFAYPYATGILPASGQLPNSAVTATTLRFYGNINNDGFLYYMEYQYDAANSWITRSMTPLSQTGKSPALPLIRNIKPGSARFTLYSDNMGCVTSIRITATIQNTWTKGSAPAENQISSMITAPSVSAASALRSDLQQYGGVDMLPATPGSVTTWASP